MGNNFVHEFSRPKLELFENLPSRIKIFFASLVIEFFIDFETVLLFDFKRMLIIKFGDEV